MSSQMAFLLVPRPLHVSLPLSLSYSSLRNVFKFLNSLWFTQALLSLNNDTIRDILLLHYCSFIYFIYFYFFIRHIRLCLIHFPLDRCSLPLFSSFFFSLSLLLIFVSKILYKASGIGIDLSVSPTDTQLNEVDFILF